MQRSYFYLGRPHCSSELEPILSLIFTITLLLAACCQVFRAELRLGRPSSASAATSAPFLSSLLLSPVHHFSIRAPEIQSSWSASLHRSFEAPRFIVWSSLSPVAFPPGPYRNSHFLVMRLFPSRLPGRRTNSCGMALQRWNRASVSCVR